MQTIPVSDMTKKGIVTLPISGEICNSQLANNANNQHDGIANKSTHKKIDEEICSLEVIQRPGDQPDEIGLNQVKYAMMGQLTSIGAMNICPLIIWPILQHA